MNMVRTNKIYYMYILTSGDHLTGCLTADSVEMLAILNEKKEQQTREREKKSNDSVCMILITVHSERARFSCFVSTHHIVLRCF